MHNETTNPETANTESLQHRCLVNAHGALEVEFDRLNSAIIGALRNGFPQTVAQLRSTRDRVERDMAFLCGMIDRY